MPGFVIRLELEIKDIAMADFGPLTQESQLLRQTVVDVLGDVLALMQDTSDQAAIDAAVLELQSIRAQLRGGVPDVDPAQPTP